MPIKIDCPRCKKSLSVPGKMAGSYATCPMCNGRFWVPPGADRDASQATGNAASDGASSPPGPAVLAPPPVVRPPSAVPPPPGVPPAAVPPPSAPSAAVPPPPSAPPTAAPPRPKDPSASVPSSPPAPARKVARFITAEAAESTLKPSDDGKLPDLHLEEGVGSRPKRTAQRSLNPLAMFALLAASGVFSLLMVFVEPSAGPPSHASQKAAARYKIQQEYFADEEHLKLESPPPLKPYQVLLRDAQRAYSRGDYRTEQQEYRKVLQLLRAERGKFEGITGSPARDRVLEEQITILLSN